MYVRIVCPQVVTETLDFRLKARLNILLDNLKPIFSEVIFHLKMIGDGFTGGR